LEPLGITIDAGEEGRWSIPAGQHEVRARFAPTSQDMDLVLDLELEEGRCLRTPVFSKSLPLEATPRTQVSVSSPLEVVADLRGLRGLIAFQAGISRWVGPTRLSAEVGYGASYCNQETCGKDDQGRPRSGHAVPLSFLAVVSPLRWELPAGSSVGLVGARYSYTPLSLPLPEGTRWFAMHGLHGVLGWGLALRRLENVRHPERAIAMEVTIPVGILVDPGSAGGKVAFSTGLTCKFFLF
jgi:hypothetical protein